MFEDKFNLFNFDENNKNIDCSTFRGPFVTMKKYLDDEWLLVDSKTNEILFIGSKEKIMDEYDRRNEIQF